MSDHVHLLSRLRPDESVSNAIRSLKANASGWMHKVFPELSDFKWQDGYGGFTVSQSQVEQVRKYIRLQEHHHQKRSFKDEFTELLKISGIEFNEEHLWNEDGNVRDLSPVSTGYNPLFGESRGSPGSPLALCCRPLRGLNTRSKRP